MVKTVVSGVNVTAFFFFVNEMSTFDLIVSCVTIIVLFVTAAKNFFPMIERVSYSSYQMLSSQCEPCDIPLFDLIIIYIY
jgi:hypothetical protein